MVNESIYDNPQYLKKDRFVWLEEKVVDINYNVSLLLVVITNKLSLLEEDGGSNAEVI